MLTLVTSTHSQKSNVNLLQTQTQVRQVTDCIPAPAPSLMYRAVKLHRRYPSKGTETKSKRCRLIEYRQSPNAGRVEENCEYPHSLGGASTKHTHRHDDNPTHRGHSRSRKSFFMSSIGLQPVYSAQDGNLAKHWIHRQKVRVVQDMLNPTIKSQPVPELKLKVSQLCVQAGSLAPRGEAWNKNLKVGFHSKNVATDNEQSLVHLMKEVPLQTGLPSEKPRAGHLEHNAPVATVTVIPVSSRPITCRAEITLQAQPAITMGTHEPVFLEDPRILLTDTSPKQEDGRLLVVKFPFMERYLRKPTKVVSIAGKQSMDTKQWKHEHTTYLGHHWLMPGTVPKLSEHDTLSKFISLDVQVFNIAMVVLLL